MSLNVPLIATPLDGLVPAAMLGEAFILQRDGIELELHCVPPDGASPRGIYRAAGRLFMTTARLCFVPRSAGSGGGGAISSVDLPLASLRGADYIQPWFAANYLSGRVLPIAGRGLDAAAGAGAPFRLVFSQGSAATLLHVLWRLLEQYARVDAAARAAFVQAASAAQAAPAFVASQTAFFDPADPSRVYIPQPSWAAPAPAPALLRAAVVPG